MSEPATVDGRPTAPALVHRLERFNLERLRAAYAAAGMDDLRPAQVRMLVPLVGGARRAADLALLVGVSRQAVAQFLAALEDRGYVRRAEDTTDARARLIELTDRGRRALRVTRAVSQRVQGRWREVLGAERLAQTMAALAELVAADQRDAAETP
ncbi:MAG: MarR family winged helix-turn-helix transcriptional regulator [Nakamurella sp.]